MLGAIIGDIVGSVYEFHNIRSKDFPLITEMSFPTDDTIMTLAVAKILQNGWQDDRLKVVETFKKWGRTFPDAGYGGRFRWWLGSDSTVGYGSYGNGSAMRVSAVGWYATDEDEVKRLSKCVTEITHSHPQGLLGAEVTAMCVFYARAGKSKEFIKKYAEQYYDLNFNYEDLVKNYKFNESCQGTVPQAIFCFLISENFEDCLRTSISIGGDSDTLAAISCAIAEAYYKHIDEELVNSAISLLPPPTGDCDAVEILKKFIEDNFE